MRVLHIFNEINFSGAEIMYADAAPIFQQGGFDMFAISTGKNFGNFTEQFIKSGIKIFHRPFYIKSINVFYLWRYLTGIIQFIKSNNIDIVHIHRSDVFLYFSICGYITKKKTIMTLHNVFKAGKYTWIKHYLTRYTARKLFNLTFQSIGKSVYLNELNYFKNPTVLVNNWYNDEKFFPATNSTEKSILRKQYKISESAFVIISIGRCTEIKNHIDILKALAIIDKEGEFICLHLGTGHLEDHEKEVSYKLGITKKVYFLGNKVNVRDYLILSDLFVMTSKFEGLSIASIEAMSCGLPSVLYNSPGLRDLISNDDNGFLIKPDYKLLAAHILKFKDLVLRHQKAKNAVQYVKLNHSMKACVRNIIKLYNS